MNAEALKNLAPVPLDDYANACLDLALARTRELGHTLDASRRDTRMICPDCRHTLIMYYGDTMVTVMGTAIALRCGPEDDADLAALLFEDSMELTDMAIIARDEAMDRTPPLVGQTEGE